MDNLLIGDVREKLKELDDSSIQCCVTSPPYWGLRDYGTANWEGGDSDCNHFRDNQVTSSCTTGHSTSQKSGGVADSIYKKVCKKCGARRKDSQLGLEETPEEYVENMVKVFREVKRVLKDDGTCWLNLGDSYYNKNLMGIPWRVAFALQQDGWYLRQDIIWNKPNPMPESIQDRCTKSHEYIFLLTKSAKYYYDADAIREKSTSDLQKVNKTFSTKTKYGSVENESKHRQGMHKERGESIVATRPELPKQVEFVSFIRQRTNAKKLSKDTGIKLSKVEHWYRNDESGFSYPSIQDWDIIREYLDDWSIDFKKMDDLMTKIELHDDSVKNNPKGRNKRSVWTITTKPFKDAHFAVFPIEIPTYCIKAGSKEGDVVLDPFMGSGTTALAAQEHGRRWVGVELNPEYVKIIKKRTQQQVLF